MFFFTKTKLPNGLFIKNTLCGLFLIFYCQITFAFKQPQLPHILVVMSYHEDFHWSRSVKRGIEARLGSTARLSYFYLDSKVKPDKAKEKAELVFAFYQENQPQGVISVDDNAQSLFVVPYLKDKVDTPIMFAGVNADPSNYGYPNHHISGILERNHIAESISFFKSIKPEAESVGFIMQDSPSGLAVANQVQSEQELYNAKNCGIEFVSTENEFIASSQKLSEKCDGVYIDAAAGIKSNSGAAMTYELMIKYLNQNFKGAVIGGNRFHVYSGALLSVAKSGYEQGEVAASMLLMAISGTPITQLPITRNYRGNRYLNGVALYRSGLNPDLDSMKGIKVIKGL